MRANANADHLPKSHLINLDCSPHGAATIPLEVLTVLSLGPGIQPYPGVVSVPRSPARRAHATNKPFALWSPFSGSLCSHSSAGLTT